MIKLLAALAALSTTCLFAQSNNAMDQYRIGAGVSYDYYGKTGFASIMDIDARASATSNAWYHMTLEMTTTQAVLKPGVEYEITKSGYWGLSAFGDAGLASGGGVTLGAFSTGGKLSYDFGSKLSKGASHYYVEFAVKVNYLTGGGTTTVSAAGVSTTSSPVQPIYSVLFTKGF